MAVKRYERKEPIIGDLEQHYITLSKDNVEIDITISISHRQKLFGKENCELYYITGFRAPYMYGFHDMQWNNGWYQLRLVESHLKNDDDIWDVAIRTIQYNLMRELHEIMNRKGGSYWQLIRDVYIYDWKPFEYERKD